MAGGGGGDGEHDVHDLFGQISPPTANGTNQRDDLFAEEIPFATNPLPEQQQPQPEANDTFLSESAEPTHSIPSLLASPSLEDAPSAAEESNPGATPLGTGAPTESISLLSASGLLGTASPSLPSGLFLQQPTPNGGAAGSGGLFDDIDQQEAAADLQKRREQQEEDERQHRMAQEKAEQQKQLQLKQQQEQQAQQKQQQEAERIRQQQILDQMQSIHLGPPPASNQSMHMNYGSPYRNTPYNLNQPQTANQPSSYSNSYQQHNQFQHNQLPQSLYGSPAQPSTSPPIVDPPVRHVNGTFYRDTNPPPPQIINTNADQSRFYQPSQLGSATAGMHGPGVVVPQQSNLMAPPQPPPQPTLYARVLVTEPLLLQTSPALFGLGQPPHWSYQLTTELLAGSSGGGGGGVWMVRRRFRHVVALEERLREDCPGAILPPRCVAFVPMPAYLLACLPASLFILAFWLRSNIY